MQSASVVQRDRSGAPGPTRSPPLSKTADVGAYNYEWYDARNDAIGTSGTVELTEGANSFTPELENAVLFLWRP